MGIRVLDGRVVQYRSLEELELRFRYYLLCLDVDLVELCSLAMCGEASNIYPESRSHIILLLLVDPANKVDFWQIAVRSS